MRATDTMLKRIAHVELRVRDLDRSAEFYDDFLGLERLEATPPSDNVCVCTATLETGESFGLVLTQGLPGGTEVAGLDHISFEVGAKQDVIDVHRKARAQRVRVTQPRDSDGHFQVYVFDPDGYKIELIAKADGAGQKRPGAEPTTMTDGLGSP